MNHPSVKEMEKLYSLPVQDRFIPPSESGESEEAVPLEPSVAKERSLYLQSMINKVLKAKSEGLTKDVISNKPEFTKFVEEYPTVFKMIMSTNELSSLEKMVNMLDNMGKSKINQHQASVIVGQHLHDIYVKPKVSGDSSEAKKMQ